MNVRSLWIRRTSKIFSRPSPALGVPIPPGVQIVALLVFLAEAAAVPAVFDVAEQLDAQLVGIEPRRRAGHRARVMVAIADQVGRLEALAGHDRRVPVAGPALVHDLGLALRGEVIGLVADDREHVELPGLERGVFQHEQHHVADRLARELLVLLALLAAALRFGRQHLRRIDVLIHVVLGGEAADRGSPRRLDPRASSA